MRWTQCAMAGVLLAGAAAPDGARACSLSGGKVGIVASIDSATSLKLQTGETVVLAGAQPSKAWPINTESWLPEVNMQSELARLVEGKTVEVVTVDRRYDRYGRLLAHVFVQLPDPSSERLWVQGELIAAGLARAYALQGTVACLDEMLALEAAARADQRGFWGIRGVFADHDATDVRTLHRLHDTFQSVVGMVARVEKLRGQPAVVFEGPDHQEFYALLAAGVGGGRSGPRHVSRGASFEGLAGKRVRVRGWIENRTRPFLVLTDPRLIELVEEPVTNSPPPPADADASPPAAK